MTGGGKGAFWYAPLHGLDDGCVISRWQLGAQNVNVSHVTVRFLSAPFIGGRQILLYGYQRLLLAGGLMFSQQTSIEVANHQMHQHSLSNSIKTFDWGERGECDIHSVEYSNNLEPYGMYGGTRTIGSFNTVGLLSSSWVLHILRYAFVQFVQLL